MVLPALAAGAARIAAVSGRAAVGAGRTAGTAGRSVGRSTSQMKSRFQRARVQNSRFQSVNEQQMQRASTKRRKKDEEDQEDEEGQEGGSGLPATSALRQLQEAQERMKMISGSQASNFKKGMAMMRTFNALQAASPEEASKTQKATKEAVKKAIPKIALFIANSLCTVLEGVTGGVGILLTFLPRVITLGWYNTEMIYGGWIMKGKHLLIGPLSWDPFPMPFAKKNTGENATVLVMLVILSDLFIIFAMMISLITLMLPAIIVIAAIGSVIP